MHRFFAALAALVFAAGITCAEVTRELDPAVEKTFTARSDNTEQKYILRLPAQFDERQPHDLMIALHGHGSDRHQYAGDPRPECRAARDVAAKHEMIFVSPDYRGNSWMGPAAESDMVQLIGELKQNFKVRKVILVGGSMGGTSVLIFTALHPELVDGVSSQNGIASLMDYDNAFAGIADAIKLSYGGQATETLAQFRQRDPAEFHKRSAVFAPEKFTMPVAITVGGKDTIVPPKTTIELAQAIQKANPDVLLINREDGGHSTSYEDTVKALEFVAERTANAEYISGKLSDRISWTTQGWGELGFDVAAHGAGQKPLALQIKDKAYARGLGHHANGEIILSLDGEFKTFQTDIGVQWQGGQNVAAVIFQIFVDGKEVFKSRTMGESDAAVPVSIPVENAAELRLVATAGVDGINCDCADWADARLIRNPGAARHFSDQHMDIAPFAQVMAWDPNAMTGTKATRVEEMPAADIFPGTELVREKNRGYQVPVKDGAGCIGLQWEENRAARQAAIEFASLEAMSAFKGVQLQYWTGESAWQGKWVSVDSAPETNANRLTWRVSFPKITTGSPKIRWVFSQVKAPLMAKNLSAFTSSGWETVEVRLESTNPRKAHKAEIEIYNGFLAEAKSGSPYHFSWDGKKPLTFKVRSNLSQRYKADRTVLRFRYPDTAFGVAIEDLQTNEAVYVPHAGLFATREPAPVTLADYLKKISGRASVLEQVRAKPDQTFPQAWAKVHRDVENIEETMVSLACDNRKFIVRRDGVLGFNEYESPDDPPQDAPGFGWLAASQWSLVPRFGGRQNPELSRHLQGDWLPAPTTVVKENDITYRQTTYVAPANKLRSGGPAWLYDWALCVVDYQIGNSGKQPAAARLSFKLTPGHDPKLAAEFRSVPEGLLAVHNDRVVALIDTRKISQMSLKHEGDEMFLSGEMPGGAEISCPVYLPAWRIPASGSSYTMLLPKKSWFLEMEDYWRKLLQPAMQVEIPEPLLTNIIRASQVWCLVAARNEARGARVAPWIASAFYGPLESEANSIIRGMDMNGHAEFSERSIDYFLGKANPAGFITTGYTLVGTAEVLWTLGEDYGRTHDRDWLKRNETDVVRICHWVMSQRAKTKVYDARGQKRPAYGLMPPGVTADWDRFAFRFFNDAQYCTGLEMAGRALADIGDPAAAAIRKDAKEYREDIQRAFHWTQARTPVHELGNGTWVPADPSFLNCFGQIEEFYPNEDGGRTWCYSIECGSHHLAATQILDPKSRDAGWIADYLEDVQFLRGGWGDYPEKETRDDSFDFGGFAKLQPYYCRIAEIHALRDDVKPFIRSYFNTIPSLVNAENLSFCEHFANYGAWNKTHETGWFLCQTRLMFVTERGDELWLAPFVTCDWLKNGEKVVVRNAPTTFGKVSYELASTEDGEIEATVKLPARFTARKVVLRLRNSNGKPMKSVTVQGKKCTDFDARGETVAFSPTAEVTTIRARY